MSEWPEYESRKTVRAAKIVHIDEGTNAHPNRCILARVDDAGGVYPFDCTHDDMQAAAQVGWYALEFPDGFYSALPPDIFENRYARIEPDAAELGAAVRSAGLAGS